jgi:hypothetical protein
VTWSFVRTKNGKVIVRHRPVRRAHSTAGELAGQSLLAQANVYGRRIRQEPDQYALYQRAANLNGKRACDLAKADFYHPPVINDVDLSGCKQSVNPGWEGEFKTWRRGFLGTQGAMGRPRFL